MKAEEKANEIINCFTPLVHIRYNKLNSLRASLKCVNYIIKAVSKYEYGYWEYVQLIIINELKSEEIKKLNEKL